MPNSRLSLPLRGIIPPMITPLVGPDELDVPGVELLVEHLLDGGVTGIFLLGSSGEGPSLSYRLRRELVSRVCKQVNGRVPVLVGITDSSLREVLAMAGHAAGAGADAVVSSAPFYLPPSQPELLRFIEMLSRQSPLPLMLYNMPILTKVIFAPETLRMALQLDNIIGLKDSSGDMGYFHTVRDIFQQRPTWSLFVGPEDLMAESVLFGGHGGVSGGANIFPRLFVNLYEAAARGDLPTVTALHARVVQLTRIYQLSRQATGFIQGMKAALRCLGICGDIMAEPFLPLGDPERQWLATFLQEFQQAK